MSRGSFLDPPTDIPDNHYVSSKILLVYEEYSEMMNTQALLQKVGFDVLGISTEYTLGENVLSFNPDVVVAFGRAGKVTTTGVGRRLREMTRWQGKVILILPLGYKPTPQDFAKVRADMLLEAPCPPLRLMQTLAKMMGLDEALLQERLAKHGTELGRTDEATEAMGGNGGENPDSLLVIGGEQEKDEGPQFVTGPLDQPLSDKPRFSFDIPVESSEPVPKKTAEKEPDLEALWNELTENSELSITPEEDAAARKNTGKKVSFDLGERAPEYSEQELEQVSSEIQEARHSDHERVSKYAKFLENITDFDPHRSLSKIASRKVQKEIAKSWNHEETENQDELRRNFTKALFKKK